MDITRFNTFLGMDEDTVLRECGHPKAMQLFDESPFYKDDKTPVFLFVEEDDINWIKKPDTFSMDISFFTDPVRKKSYLFTQIVDSPIAVFLKEADAFVYYGIYKLDAQYYNGSGLIGVVEHYSRLVFQNENRRDVF